jgi:lysophospholipase L1-like esterase
MGARRRSRAFRPDLLISLEDRTALSQGVGPALVSAPTPISISTTPTPGNTALSASDWMSLHDQYVARARRGHEPVVVLGDSITYFWGDPHVKVLPDLVPPWGTPAWQASMAPLRASGFGAMGDETENLLWRVENGELRGRPRVAVVLIGLNNLLQGQTPEETAAGTAAVVGAIRTASPTTRVLLLGLLPTGPAFGAPLRAEIRAVNAEIAGLAGGMVTYLDAGSAFVQADGTVTPGLVQDVTVHPTLAGYQALSAEVAPAIQSLLHPGRLAARRV